MSINKKLPEIPGLSYGDMDGFESLYYIDSRTSLSFLGLLTVIMQEIVPQNKVTASKNYTLRLYRHAVPNCQCTY